MADAEIERTLVEHGTDGPEIAGVPEAGEANEAAADGITRSPGCRTERRGWAGAHLHGAVRPRRRPVGRGRPPGRWC